MATVIPRAELKLKSPTWLCPTEKAVSITLVPSYDIQCTANSCYQVHWYMLIHKIGHTFNMKYMYQLYLELWIRGSSVGNYSTSKQFVVYILLLCFNWSQQSAYQLCFKQHTKRENNDRLPDRYHVRILYRYNNVLHFTDDALGRHDLSRIAGVI